MKPSATLHSLLPLALAGIALLAAAPLRAQTLPSSISPDMRYADTCFSRSYSDSHLRTHPRQVTSRIVLASLDRPAGQITLPPNSSEMLIAIQTRRTSIWKTRLAYCRFAAGAASRLCQIESDGGSFTLTDRPDGSVLIRTRGEIRLGSEDTLAEIGGRLTDDNSFVLFQAACRRASSR